jgi:hypothetical protein
MNSPRRPQYAVGRWESLWASDPYMSHRIIIDLSARKVIAGQDRYHKRWHPMSVRDVDYMQQILEETADDIFDEPREHGFELVDHPPAWALEPWPWPRIYGRTDDEYEQDD